MGSSKYKVKSNKYSAKSNKYSTNSNKYKTNCNYIYLYLPLKCGILLQFATKVWHIRDLYCPIRELEMYPKMGYKQTMYPKYPNWGIDGVQKLGPHKMEINSQIFG